MKGISFSFTFITICCHLLFCSLKPEDKIQDCCNTNSEKSNLFCSIAEKWKGSHFRDGSLTRLFQYRRYPGLQGF